MLFILDYTCKPKFRKQEQENIVSPKKRFHNLVPQNPAILEIIG